jgi:hypothetical protein
MPGLLRIDFIAAFIILDPQSIGRILDTNWD